MAGEATRIVNPEDLRSAKNSSGSTIVKNTVVKWHTTEDEIVLPAAATDPLAGVVQDADIANTEWGTVQQRGKALCRAEGALATIGVRLQATTAGRVEAHTGTNSIVGTLLTTAAAQDDIVEVELAGPGVTGT